MKKVVTSLLSLALTVSVFASGKEVKETVMSVSPTQSTLTWHGEKVTGKHHGNVSIRQGNIILDGNGDIKSAYVQVDMQTITCEDLTDAKSNARLVGHLKSDDFFGVENHPFAEIKLDEFKPAKEAGTYQASGKLTIKGKSHPITVPFTMNKNGGEIVADGKFTFDRAKYDIRYGSGSFFDDLGDKAIYDDVDLHFNVKAAAKPKK